MDLGSIKIEGLGKRYRRTRAGRAEPVGLGAAFAAAMRRTMSLGRRGAATVEDFWALRDLSASIAPGETIGIVGENGAGKSTLLKLLSRTTAPTTGRALISGRIGSLLEIGAGFHGDLSGRENIYLSGAVLGMTRREINARFSRIVEFSGVGASLEMPVKRYSSGMYLRLAFAVAAFLDCEILIIDELLAVGDVEFQKRCVETMDERGKSGKTVLCVSHNLSVIQRFCKRSWHLSHGRLVGDGPTTEVLVSYLAKSASRAAYVAAQAQPATAPRFASIRLLEIAVDAGAKMSFEAVIDSPATQPAGITIRLRDAHGTPVGMGSAGYFEPDKMLVLQPGRNVLCLRLDASSLAVGDYLVSFDVYGPGGHHFERLENALGAKLTRSPPEGHVLVLEQKWGEGSMQLDIDASFVQSIAQTG